MRIIKNYLFRASNNQLLFNVLTMFESPVTSARPRWFQDVLVRDVRKKRQERRPTSRRPSRIAWIEIFTQRTTFNKKQTVRRVLFALPHSRDAEVLRDEDRVVIMCASDRNWWIHRHCGDVHGCLRFLRCPLTCYVGISWSTPRIQKNG
jgi:hypothetical protein